MQTANLPASLCERFLLVFFFDWPCWNSLSSIFCKFGADEETKGTMDDKRRWSELDVCRPL